MLKHEMIIGMRGVCIYAYEAGEACRDEAGVKDVIKLARRIHELLEITRAEHSR